MMDAFIWLILIVYLLFCAGTIWTSPSDAERERRRKYALEQRAAQHGNDNISGAGIADVLDSMDDGGGG